MYVNPLYQFLLLFTSFKEKLYFCKMNKIIIRFATCLIFILCGASCSNDIDLSSEWKDIPVVYGFLSISDSIHYIRVEKAFIDQNTSALDIAQIPDSLYYDDAVVQVNKVGSTEPPITFQKVDGNEEGFIRDDGIFATSPNYIYKYEFPQGQNFESLSEYELQINRGDNLPLVTGSTVILEDVDIRAPLSPTNSSYRPFRWGDNENAWSLEISWRAKPIAAIYDVVLILHIEEHEVNNPNNPTLMDLQWEVFKNIPSTEGSTNGDIVSIKSTITSESFFNYIKSSFEVNNNVFRRFRGIDIIVRSGGAEVKEYLDVGQVNSGITSSQIIPTFTNMSEGFGIFTSVNETRFNGHSISGLTQDSLADGQITKDLNFQ